MNNQFLELPVHLIFDIFSRLPIKTVFSCRCVCKIFSYLLSHPDYALPCLKKTPSTLLIRESPENYLPRIFYHHAYLVDLEETNCSIHTHYPFAALPKYKIYCLPEVDKLELVGSCNGFLCFYQPESFLYYVCNPLFGEYMVLPPPSPVPTDYIYLNYFGFCPKTNQYKVIRFVSTLLRSNTVVEIHTLGTKSWRNIVDAPRPSPRGSFEPFLRGILYLIVDSIDTSSDLIWSFNLENEQFRPIQPPVHFDFEYMNNVSWIQIGVFEGSLCICYVYDKSCFEAWIVNEYGIKESWVKKFVVDYNKCQMHVGDRGHPLVFMRNGDMWMMYTCLYVYKYNLQNGNSNVFDICGIDESFEAIAYVPSFVSLKDAVTGNGFKVEKC